MPQLHTNEDTLWLCHTLKVQCKIGRKQYCCLTTMKQAKAHKNLSQKSPNVVVVSSCCWILIFAKLFFNDGRLCAQCNLVAPCNKLLTRCCHRVASATSSPTLTDEQSKIDYCCTWTLYSETKWTTQSIQVNKTIGFAVNCSTLGS